MVQSVTSSVYDPGQPGQLDPIQIDLDLFEYEKTEISTPSGVLHIEHKITLGDITVSVLLSTLIITHIVKWIIRRVW